MMTRPSTYDHVGNEPIGTIAHYQLQQRLARGGMSRIYLAYDPQLKQTVAIKLVHNDESDYCTRFQREVKAIAQLHHDHILPAFDWGTENEWCYMVMPYIEDGTLNRRLERGPLASKEASQIFTQLADAVQFAHDHGILHRDIKPSNILLRDGQHVYLTDFGLVRNVEEDSAITATGYVIGTPEYMAPEQAEHPATKKSDIYSLGIVLYQMLTGRVPFKGSTPIGTCWKHLHEEPVPPSTLNPTISPATEAVILRALSKDPRQRFQSAKEFALAYQRSLTADDVVSRSSLSLANTLALPIQHLTGRWRVHPGMIALVALLLLFITPTTLGFLLSSSYGAAQYQAPTLLGASGSFFKGQIPTPSHEAAKTTATSTPTATPNSSSNSLSHYTPSPTASPPAGQGGTSGGGNPGHGGKGGNGGGGNGGHGGHGGKGGNGGGHGHNGHDNGKKGNNGNSANGGNGGSGGNAGNSDDDNGSDSISNVVTV